MKLQQEAKTNSHRARSEATQTALMQAAEKLIAERGIENVSIRDIVGAAGQKNESALQYHFKNFSGLIEAIHNKRSAETQALRSQLLAGLLEETAEPTLRQLCELMVQPSYELARSKVDYRRYIRAFGDTLMLAESSALSIAARNGAGGSSGQQLTTLLRKALPHLDKAAYRRRMDGAVRLCSASMFHQARQKNAFRGDAAALFFHGLMDSLEGLLSAPESSQTKTIAKALAKAATKNTIS